MGKIRWLGVPPKQGPAFNAASSWRSLARPYERSWGSSPKQSSFQNSAVHRMNMPKKKTPK